ncbi:hypothetical protein BJF78_26970 [Pseudonocardia sp. CNS-139]|nr:hypothetical protein BJF78_26970 [Pseudonocardia sp. CNS-139]
MTAVVLDRVTKRFGETVACDGIDLSLASGESLVVLGPSGSGKSTLLRIVAGLEEPDGGEVLIGGTAQSDLPPHRRDVAIVFQHFALYPHLTALDNITLGLRHGLGLSRQEAHARATDVAERLAITDLLRRQPRAMSGGQRQRVALARALARRAGVVLLDEPLSGLDAQLRLALRAEIASVLRSTGATTIHVTHDQTDAMALADRIAVLRAGRVEQVGAPDDLYRRPASLFVAGFIGSPPMNTLTIEPGGTSPFGSGPDHGEAVVLGVRPEQLHLGGDGPWRARALVTLVEHEGPSTILHLDVEGAVENAGAPMRLRTPPDGVPSAGQHVVVTADPADVLVFAAGSGLALGTAADLPRGAEMMARS